MSEPVVVLSDPARLDAVRRLLRTSSPEGLDRLTGLAALLLRAPSAQVSLLSDEQYIAAGVGPAVEPQATSPAADSLCGVTVELGRPLAVGDAAHDPRVQMLPPVEEGGVLAYLGVPLMDRAGLVVGALCVHDVQVRTWTPADIGVLSELAASVVAELELLALTQELVAGAAHVELAMSAAGAGAFEWHISSGRLVFDDRLVELFGYTRDDFDDRVRASPTASTPMTPSARARPLQLGSRGARTSPWTTGSCDRTARSGGSSDEAASSGAPSTTKAASSVSPTTRPTSSTPATGSPRSWPR